MDLNAIKCIIEAVLLSSYQPVSLTKLADLFDEWQRPSKALLDQAIQHLRNDYQARSFELVEVSSGYRIQTKKNYSEWITRLHAEKPSKYSRALLETLAIIAYKQPVTRADIEQIRGVAASSHIMKTLMERNWICIAGQKDVPGKPAIYSTTKEFLDYFNLQHISELPLLPKILADAEQPITECINE